MLYGAVKDNFGRYYKVHMPSDGRIPLGLQSRQFDDPVYTKQFLRGLQTRESHWRHLVSIFAGQLSPHLSVEDAFCQLLISGRVKIFDVTDYAVSRLNGGGSTFKSKDNLHVQVLPASAQLMVNSPAKRFDSAKDAASYLSQIGIQPDQLRKLANENNLSAGNSNGQPQDSLKALAEAIAQGKLIIVETIRNDASGKKAGEELLEVHDRLPGNRRPTLGPHAGSSTQNTGRAAAAAASAAAVTSSTSAEEDPICSLSQFELKCCHGSRGYNLDVINGEADLNNSKGIQVVSRHDSPDKITITLNGSCVNGLDNCPSVSVTGDSGTEKVNKGSTEIKVLPRQVNEQVTSFMGFVKKYMVPDLGRMQYQTYRFTSSGCAGCESHSAIVHAFPTYKWSGKVGFGYRDKDGKDSKDESSLAVKGGWFLDAGLTGNIHKNTWNFETKDQNQISDYFPALKGFVTDLVEKLDDIASKTAEAAADAGGLAIGGDALKFKVSWPKVTLGGGMSLEEVKGKNIVDLDGNVKLSMSPLLGLDIEADVIDWIMWNAGPHGELIRAVRNKIKEGIGTTEVNASADISVKLKMKGSVNVDFEWKKAAGDRWQITKGDGTGKTAMAVTVGLEGKAEATTRIFMVKIAIGITVGVMGANSSGEGIGVGFSLFATTKEDKPAIGGDVRFTGVAIYYTYYAEAMVVESESREKQKQWTRTSKTGEKNASRDSKTKQKIENKYTLLKACSWPKPASSETNDVEKKVNIDSLNI